MPLVARAISKFLRTFRTYTRLIDIAISFLLGRRTFCYLGRNLRHSSVSFSCGVQRTMTAVVNRYVEAMFDLLDHPPLHLAIRTLRLKTLVFLFQAIACIFWRNIILVFAIIVHGLLDSLVFLRPFFSKSSALLRLRFGLHRLFRISVWWWERSALHSPTNASRPES